MVVFHNKVKSFCVEKKGEKKLSRKEPPLKKTHHKEEEKEKTWHTIFFLVSLLISGFKKRLF